MVGYLVVLIQVNWCCPSSTIIGRGGHADALQTIEVTRVTCGEEQIEFAIVVFVERRVAIAASGIITVVALGNNDRLAPRLTAIGRATDNDVDDMAIAYICMAAIALIYCCNDAAIVSHHHSGNAIEVAAIVPRQEGVAVSVEDHCATVGGIADGGEVEGGLNFVACVGDTRHGGIDNSAEGSIALHGCAEPVVVITSGEVADGEGCRSTADARRSDLRLGGRTRVACREDFRRVGAGFIECQGRDIALCTIEKADVERYACSISEWSCIDAQQHHFAVTSSCLPSLCHGDAISHDGQVGIIFESDRLGSCIYSNTGSAIQREVCVCRRHTRRQEDVTILIDAGETADITAGASNLCRLRSIVAEDLPSDETSGREVGRIDVVEIGISRGGSFANKVVTAKVVWYSISSICGCTLMIKIKACVRLANADCRSIHSRNRELLLGIVKVLTIRHLPSETAIYFRDAEEALTVGDGSILIAIAVEANGIVGAIVSNLVLFAPERMSRPVTAVHLDNIPSAIGGKVGGGRKLCVNNGAFVVVADRHIAFAVRSINLIGTIILLGQSNGSGIIGELPANAVVSASLGGNGKFLSAYII